MTAEQLAAAAAALRHIARNESLKAYVLDTPALQQALLPASRSLLGS